MSEPNKALQTLIANLAKNTGKSLGAWHQALKKNGFSSATKHGDLMKYLKGEAGITHGYANLIALQFRAPSDGGEEDLVGQQYSGDKAALKPIYDRLIKQIKGFGKDVEIAPKKTYVSLRRSKQFALIQPSTKTRLDIGINLKGTAPSGRLEKSGSFNAMVSHRVRLESSKDVDAELLGWLRAAYEQA